MRRPPLILALLALTQAIPSLVLANGGGYTRGGVSETGTIRGFEPSGMKRVSISNEQLDIALGQTAARVEVRYVLRNSGERKTEVRFGFPVEELASEDTFAELGEAKPRGRSSRAKLEYCRDYQVTFGGKAIAAKFQPEPAKSAAQDKRFKGIRGWLVSEIPVGPGEDKEMIIKFRADYPYSAESISDDGHVSARIFKYRLSTGAAWDGPIARGRIVVRADGVDPNEVKILQPVNRFRRSGAQWEWSFEKLDPTLADDLSIEAVPQESSYGRSASTGKMDPTGNDSAEFIERAGKWYIAHTNYNVTASSTLRPDGDTRYDAKNVREWNAVWSEGAPGPGIGEWLELKPEVARPLRSVRIRPGNWGSDYLFEGNARPKRIELLLNGEHRFEVSLVDSKEEQTALVQGYDKRVKSLRLTIRDVYPGTRHNDLCISHVTLETRATKTPKISPTR